MDDNSQFFVYIDSTHRMNTDTAYSYSITAPFGTLSGLKVDEFIKVTLVQMTFINDIPALQGVSVTVNGSVLSIPNGNYRVTDIVAYFNSNVSGVSISYSSTTNRFSFAGSGTIVFTAASGPVFGFAAGSVSLPATSVYPIKVRTINEIFVYLTSLSAQQANLLSFPNAQMRLANLIGVIPVETFPGGYCVFRNPASDFSTEVSDKSITDFSFEFRDSSGNLLTSMPEHKLVMRIESWRRPSRTLEKKMDELVQLTRMHIVFLGLLKSFSETHAEENAYEQVILDDVTGN